MKRFYLALCLILPLSLSAQTRLNFISDETGDSISHVLVQTKSGNILSSGNTASLILLPADFPAIVTRSGFEKQTVIMTHAVEHTIRLRPNLTYSTVTVTAKKRERLTASFSSMPTHPVSIDSLRLSGTTSAKSFISSKPELQLRDFGGSTGFQTLTSRGTTSAQNIVTVNGIIVNNLTTGTASLTALPWSYFSVADLQTGGFSADISNGAFGSVLSLLTNTSDSSYTFLSSVLGSFRKKSFSGLSNQNVMSYNVRFSLQHIAAENDFSYPFQTASGKVSQLRTNNSDQSLYINTGLSKRFETTLAQSDFFVTAQNQNVPGPVFYDNLFPSTAEMNSSSYRNITTTESYLSNGIVRLSVSLHHHNFNFMDKTYSAGLSLNDRYYENEAAVRSDYLTTWDVFEIGIGQYTRYITFSAEQKFSNQPFTERFTTGLYFSIEAPFFVVHGMKQKLSLRTDAANSLPSILSGSYSLLYNNNSHTAGLSLNHSNRYPTFSELHFSDFGAPLLKPEKMKGLDVYYRLAGDNLKLSVKSFAYVIRDKIISIPKNPVQWITMNAENAAGYGAEESVQFSVSGFDFQQSLAVNRIFYLSDKYPAVHTKQLVYTPIFSASGEISKTWNQFIFFTRLRFNGERFTSQENLESDKLPSFILYDAGLTWRKTVYQTDLTIQFQIYNFSNTAYEWIKSYPQPGRSFELTTGISL